MTCRARKASTCTLHTFRNWILRFVKKTEQEVEGKRLESCQAVSLNLNLAALNGRGSSSRHVAMPNVHMRDLIPSYRCVFVLK